ncbi:MAG: cytochrome c oxidase subunit II [Geminicoccaceae bacterium]|nr:cytochrome c oxidase subunit II [Geminicoccaceae bacterium]
MEGLSFFPKEASTFAPRTDAVFFTLLGLSAFMTLAVAFLLVYFCTRYRRGSKARHGGRVSKLIDLEFEAGWSLIPLFIFLFLFTWAAGQEFTLFYPPKDALEISVVGKQWMWKTEHPGGQREINALHIPIGRPIKLDMVSQDTIHSFYVPAFRVKHDVVPGRDNEMWFEAKEPGAYRLFCAEFCGTDHSRMIGTITAMPPEDYARWLDAQPTGETLVAEGRRLYHELGCSGCHEAGGSVRAPPLHGLYGGPVPLEGGAVVTADERYVRDSILRPKSQVAAGYKPIMPSFQGSIDEGELQALQAWIRSIGDGGKEG